MYSHFLKLLSPHSLQGLRIYVNPHFQHINELKYAILNKFGHQTQLDSVIFERNVGNGDGVVIRDDVNDMDERFLKLVYRDAEVEQWLSPIPDHVIGSSPIVNCLVLIREIRERAIRDVIISVKNS